MSGLVGAVRFDGGSVDRGTAEAMAAAASYRSPDGVEVWRGPGAAFGYQRRLMLAHEADMSGLVHRDGVVCVADARLDNRDELLSALGPHESLAAQPGEAELILAAYRKWGTRAATRLIGDFAFVIWDTRRRRLIGARDPAAMRGLAYWIRAGRSVHIATEVQQLLVLPDLPVALNEVAVLGDLLGTLGRPEWTFYEGVANLAPGYLLVADAHGHRTERYWRPDPTFRIWHDSETDYASHLRDTFVEAVAGRLRTRHPAGVLLSGGVDSGSVAAASGWLIAEAAVDAPSIHALTWQFDTLPQCDERHISRLLVDHFELNETPVPVDDAGPLAGFPAHGPDRNEPFLFAFQPAIERSLEAARSAGLGLILGGDRGDLVIGPTPWGFLGLARARRWRDLVVELGEQRKGAGDSWARIARDHLLRRLVPFVARNTLRESLQLLAGRGHRAPGESVPSWLRPSPALVETVRDSAAPAAPPGFNYSRRMRHNWIFSQLNVRGVAWSERTYARYGLAFADPFSDRRVWDLALALPQTVINPPGVWSKPLMREAMRGIMPEHARRAATKILPTPLYERALREDAAETIRGLLARPRLSELGWVDGRKLRAEYEEWKSGSAQHRLNIWRALSVEIWLRQYW